MALLLGEPEVRAFEDPVSATEGGLVERLELGGGGELRVEAFRFVPRGRRWDAQRPDIGRASVLRGRSEGRPQLELDLTWGVESTRVRRVLRALEGAGAWSYVFREWRAEDEGRLEGRGLVLDASAEAGGPVLRLREWAGTEQRSEELTAPAALGAPTTLLALLEARRAQAGPRVRILPVFDPIEARLAPTLVLETWLGPAAPHARLVDLVDLEQGPDGRPRLAARPARWLFHGRHLLGWLEGDLEAVRDPAAELVARR